MHYPPRDPFLERDLTIDFEKSPADQHVPVTEYLFIALLVCVGFGFGAWAIPKLWDVFQSLVQLLNEWRP